MPLKMAEIMDKLKITEGEERFCWACGAGHKQLNNEMYHSRGKCSMPWYNNDPHECVDGIFLMHKDTDCPYEESNDNDDEEDDEKANNETASDEEDNSNNEEQNEATATKNVSDNSESGDEE